MSTADDLASGVYRTLGRTEPMPFAILRGELALMEDEGEKHTVALTQEVRALLMIADAARLFLAEFNRYFGGGIASPKFFDPSRIALQVALAAEAGQEGFKRQRNDDRESRPADAERVA